MAEPTDKDTRGPVNLRIKFRSESLQQFIERYGVDVSRGGIFIRTREPLPVGTRLKLDFQLVDTVPLFQGDGTVVWIREHDPARAGVTPGMGVRFDRLTGDSQTTLDTILEEKIRLQQSGVAPGSVAKAGAGMAVRRPSGAFATLDAQGGKPGGPPPLPVGVKLDTSIAPPAGAGAAPTMGAAPASPHPAASSRSGAHATVGSSSIFNRPRTTSGGMRSVPVPSALFEAPTAADIDKALSVLEEKGGGPPPMMPAVVPTVVKRADAKAVGDDDPTRVFDATASEEFAQNEAITGKGEVLPESGVPIAKDGDDLTARSIVDPGSGAVKSGKSGKVVFDPLPDAGGNGEVKRGDVPPAAAASLDAPLASLVDSGSAPAAKPAAPPPMKPAASPPKSGGGVPMRITTDRPAAIESGRFRSDTRYKRPRGKWVTWAVLLVLIGGAGAGGGWYVKRMRAKRAADALAAAAAAPPLAAGQINNAAPPPATGTEAPSGTAVAPPEATGPGTAALDKAAAAKLEEAAVNVEKPGQAAKPTDAKSTDAKPTEKTAAGEKSGRSEEGQTKRRRERAARTEAAAAGEKAAPAAGEKRPAGDEAKAAGDGAKTEPPKPTEAAKPAEGEKTEKPAEAAKPAEGEKAPEAAAVVTLLKITSSPTGAEVVIDGIPRGNTPFSSKDITPDATHAITVKKDGYEAHERMISGSDWSRARGGVQSLKFNVKLKRTGGEPAKQPAEGEKKPPEVEILTPGEP